MMSLNIAVWSAQKRVAKPKAKAQFAPDTRETLTKSQLVETLTTISMTRNKQTEISKQVAQILSCLLSSSMRPTDLDITCCIYGNKIINI